MSVLSAFMLPGVAALGVLDSATVEQRADGSLPSRPRGGGRKQTSALAQYQCMMALHNETHAGMHFGLARLCLFLSGSADSQQVCISCLRLSLSLSVSVCLSLSLSLSLSLTHTHTHTLSLSLSLSYTVKESQLSEGWAQAPWVVAHDRLPQ